MTFWHRTAIVAGAVCLVNACASSSRNGPALQERDWPTYLGRAGRAGAGLPDTLAGDPQPVWRTSVARGIAGAPAVTEDVVALSLVDNRVALLDRATGAVLWTRRIGAPPASGPLVRDDRLFVAEQNQGGRIHALRLLNGTTIWSARAGDVVAPLLLAGGDLFFATGEGAVGRLDPQTGASRWRARVGGAVRTTPVLVPAGLVVVTRADSLFLLDPATGAVRTRRTTRGAVLAAPAAGDSLLVLGTSTGRLDAFDAATLQPRWTIELGDIIVGSVAIRAGHAYAVTGRGLLVIVPLGDPGGARRLPLDIVSRAGPAPSPQGVLLSGVRGEIVLVDSLGNRRWTARIEAPIVEPVVVDARTIIAVSQRGDVVMFR